ncbi:MAG TPA: YggS family pyridoxal phosphate-dependent enzyme [Parachlamydiaceae bacterium]|nr:YggS family pyridoxal phosphate-dependent enzyme [Parachlamydiaceae bacterium]
MKKQIVRNYQELLQNIEKAALASHRKKEDVHLIAVTKGQPVENIIPLYEAGCRDFGESRIQEALVKIEFLPKDINWHFVGNLQKNKVQKAIEKFHLVQSVDSIELGLKISACAGALNMIMPILLEVNISKEKTKHGFLEEELSDAFERLLKLPNIKIKGLMGMGPLTKDLNLIRHSFSCLKKLSDALFLPMLSMGMSQDYELAIQEGATHLRIGSLLFKESLNTP